MKIFTLTRLIVLCCLLTVCLNSHAQTGVLDPDDPVNIYNPANPPETPAYGTLAKWVKTTRVGFNTTSYKAYFYKGMAFRIKFPKTYKDSLSTGKKYPIFIFFPGVGSKGTVYDNENQLASGASKFMSWVDNGTFDGFILCPQTSSASGAFNANHYLLINELIENYFIPELKVDPFRVTVNGLSGGGGSTWQMLKTYPKLIAGGLPISAVSNYDADAQNIANLKYTPIWLFQGGLDNGPAPFTARGVVSSFEAAGSNITYTEYPTLGHSSWNAAWAEANFPVFINKANKANPWPEFGRFEFCPGDAINQVLGVTAGFDDYEWRKDGAVLSGANSNTYIATAKGVYDCRIKRGDTWSVWSPIPVIISEKGVTLSPAIQFTNPSSIYLPSPASPVSAQLEVPKGYSTYTWKKEGDTTTLSNTRFLTVSAAGQYKVKVTETYGCSSEFSTLFTIKNTNAAGAPAPVSSLAVAALSKTELKLTWVKGNSTYPETGFEIFKSGAPDGTYELAGVAAAGSTGYTQTGLLTNTSYYFKVRAVNAQAASSPTSAVGAATLADTTAPVAPTDLRVLGTTRSSVELTWNESIDDVQVAKYLIYVNGVKYQETDLNSFTVYNLTHGASYVFQVQAVDNAGNISASSNQVSAQPLQLGLNFKYYTTTDSWTQLPDFSTLTPFINGFMPNVTIAGRTQDDFFSYLWEGFITIPVTGTYYFRTSSDEGSKLWLGGLGEMNSPYSYTGAATVNNDGIHSSVAVSSVALTLQAGVYPIAIAYFDRTGGQSMAVSWRTPSSGTSYVSIPNTAFTDPAPANGLIPVAPVQFTAAAISYKRIDLAWVDNSNNETAFEIWRSTDPLENFTMVKALPANNSSFTDTTALLPSTRYYYKVRAVGQYGESPFAPSKTDAQGFWRFNDNYDDASGNARILRPVNNPVFDSTIAKEPSHSLKFNGTTQYVDFVLAADDYLRQSYSKKSVAFWMKSNSNTGNRNVIDIGNRDHGLAIRLDANKIYAGIASSNIRYSVSANYTNTDWHHIAMVYDTNTLRLYIDGVEAGVVTGMTFNSIPAAAATSSIGRVNSSNAFNVGAGFFDGWIDELSIFGKALTPAEVVSIRERKYSNQYAETLSLPAVPSIPGSLTAQAQSSSGIQLSWADTSTNVAAYELYRATATADYVLVATLADHISDYTDSLLQPNTAYFYKIRSTNAGGASGFSTADTATTLNNKPVLTAIASQFVHFGDTLSVAVTATDTGSEALQFSFTGLPAFASYDSIANGASELKFTPQLADTGSYHITVKVADGYGGADTLDFSLLVHTNAAPSIAAISNITLDEKTTYQFSLQASDENAGDSLQWSFEGLPPFAVVDLSAAAPHISLQPGYADHGQYTVMAKVKDGKGGVDTASFLITVNDVNPVNTIWVSFTDGTYNAASPWNNTGKAPIVNATVANLKDEKGNTTSIGLTLPVAWFGSNNMGVNTGNNTGIYPDAVLRSSYAVSAARTMKVYGLDPGKYYDFTFLGSRANPTVGVVTNYSIGAQTVSLNSANNAQQTVAINHVQPAADSSIVVTVANAAGSAYGYLNAMVIRSVYDDNSLPAKPRNLSASVQGDSVLLSWIDAAYNERSYEIYRSTQPQSSFVRLNAGDSIANLTQYADTAIVSGATYYYAVRTRNALGYSPFSDTVSVTVPNIAPVLDQLTDIALASTQTLDIAIVATDPGDQLVLSVSQLPSFASFTDNGNGTGLIHLAAGAAPGVYTGITVTATDQHGAASSKQFSITVTLADLTTVYINFNQTQGTGSPWNNTNSAPSANLALSNLKDGNNAATGITMTLLDAWTAAATAGVVTGNNSGVYPDEVIKSLYYYNGAGERRIKMSGLNSSKKYDFTFFASRANYSTALTTQYKIGENVVELNATDNASLTVKIEGILPDSNGEILIRAIKSGSSPNAYLGAMVIDIHPYDSLAEAVPPVLTAKGISASQIKLDWTSTVNSSEYEIWKAAAATGTYVKLTTVAGTVNTYTVAGLNQGAISYYKVKAIVNSQPTAFSNYAGASTVAYILHLNLNDGSANAPAQIGNWNNTNTLITEGFELANMINDEGQNTGINFTLTREFSGFNTYGATTGNNSGVYPDNVIKNFYYLNFADTAKIRITGLVLAHQYNFAFFGSRVNPQVGVTAAYKIGNQTALLDAANNTSNTARITGVVPDADGSVTITVYGVNVNGFAYLGAMSIEGAPMIQPDPALGINPLGRNDGLITHEQADSAGTATLAADADNATAEIKQQGFTVYPNPFTDQVRVSFHLEQSTATVMIRVADMNGRIIHVQKIDHPAAGSNVYQLNLPASLQRGIYLVEVSGLGGSKPVVSRILKR
jgi:hypothetical protein